LLITTEFSSPVILVGHSLGGLLARDYAQSHPENVAGLVLLDATSDAGIEELVFAYEATVPRLDEAIAASRPGTPVVTMPVGTSDEVIMAFTPEILRGVRTEFGALDRRISEGSLLSQGVSLGDLPVVVIRRGRMSNPPTQADLDHRSGQETLLALSSNSILITAENSGHAISLDEPLVVADAVRKVIEAFDSDGRLVTK
jgi:pimeloyl-ACP methyl ester carboxylesterase